MAWLVPVAFSFAIVATTSLPLEHNGSHLPKGKFGKTIVTAPVPLVPKSVPTVFSLPYARSYAKGSPVAASCGFANRSYGSISHCADCREAGNTQRAFLSSFAWPTHLRERSKIHQFPQALLARTPNPTKQAAEFGGLPCLQNLCQRNRALSLLEDLYDGLSVRCLSRNHNEPIRADGVIDLLVSARRRLRPISERIRIGATTERI